MLLILFHISDILRGLLFLLNHMQHMAEKSLQRVEELNSAANLRNFKVASRYRAFNNSCYFFITIVSVSKGGIKPRYRALSGYEFPGCCRLWF